MRCLIRCFTRCAFGGTGTSGRNFPAAVPGILTSDGPDIVRLMRVNVKKESRRSARRVALRQPSATAHEPQTRPKHPARTC
jgi:hypothetical protein